MARARVIGEGCERGALRVARGEGGGRREHAGWLGGGPRAWSGGARGKGELDLWLVGVLLKYELFGRETP